MRGNPLHFAVVREDPLIEAHVVRETGARRVLLIASGGCTALSLQALFPGLEVTVLDRNPAQLAHVQRKADALASMWLSGSGAMEAFNVGTDAESGLNACGNFESLFRGFHRFLFDLVLPRDAVMALLARPQTEETLQDQLFSNTYWPVAFDMFFADPVLRAMFGAEAIQHGPPDTYARYFQSLMERGLRCPTAHENYFLHHMLLGHYVAPHLPPYLQQPAQARTRLLYVDRALDEVEGLADFDVVNISNLFDWMTPQQISAIVKRLEAGMKRGAVFVLRQLNHETNYKPLFGSAFTFDETVEADLLRSDRSLFYGRLTIGTRT